MLAWETPPHLRSHALHANAQPSNWTFYCLHSEDAAGPLRQQEKLGTSGPPQLRGCWTAAAAPSAHMAGAGRDVETPAAVPASTSAVTECLPALRDPARSRSPQRHTCSPRSSSSIASTCLDSPSSPVADRPEEAVLSGPDGKCGIRVVLRPGRAATLVACCETTSLLQPRQVYVVRDGVALQGKLVAVRMHCLEVW